MLQRKAVKEVLIKIGNFDCTEVWDGVFYKTLSDYPHITAWEIRNILDFMDYEKAHDRECKIQCESSDIIAQIENAARRPAKYKTASPPPLITECTACPRRKGCETAFVCHTAPVENALKILQSGKLLSAVKARDLPAEQLMAEPRNAAHDPADFFHYIMFSWGNCQAGDRLVMERKLNCPPDEKALSTDFTPGVRFYFTYRRLLTHPNAVTDGFLPIKIKDKLILSDWIHTIIIPTIHKPILETAISPDLKNKVIYVENDCKDI